MDAREGTLLSDASWLQFLVGPGDRAVAPHWQRARILRAIDSDPLVFEYYSAGAALLAVVHSDARGASAVIEKGIRLLETRLTGLSGDFKNRFWPRPWSLYITQAYVELFELDRLDSAAVAFVKAAESPGAPAYLSRLARQLSSPRGKWEVAERLLHFQLLGAATDDERTGLTRKLHSFRVLRFLEEVQAMAPAQRPKVDPWGGRLSVSIDGELTTTTPHQPVLGLGPRLGARLKSCRSSSNVAC